MVKYYFIFLICYDVRSVFFYFIEKLHLPTLFYFKIQSKNSIELKISNLSERISIGIVYTI